MPRSLTFSVLISILGTLFFVWWKIDDPIIGDQQEVVNISVTLFNAAAIFSFLCILYRSEKVNDEEFGITIRDNISTIVVSLLMNLIIATHTIYNTFTDRNISRYIWPKAEALEDGSNIADREKKELR